jgi:ArsR family transcriptional regulator
MLSEADKYLKHIGKNSFDLRLGELSHLPMKDRETDCAIINMVLHYLDDPYSAIKEAYRIIKKGGKLVITELDSHSDESIRNIYNHKWLGFSSQHIKNWLSSCGFIFKRLKIFQAGKDLNVA